jgi:hypothetical protein
MVRYYELFEDQTEIKRLLEEYFNITGPHTIKPDGTVDIEGDCILKLAKKVNQLPVKFGKVSGNFNCSHTQLTSLVGSPQSVGDGFYCYRNQLTSLVGAPQSVGGTFDCAVNRLTSLEGAPQSVGGNFSCSRNQLTSLVGAPQLVRYDFSCNTNHLISLEGAPQSVGRDFRCNWTPTLPLLRTVVAKEVVIYKGNDPFKEINDILNSSIEDNPGSYRKAALDAKRKLTDAGYKGNAKW